MKLKTIILEGMYDRLVGQINKDIFSTLKKVIAGSGTLQKPKKYKGYPVRKEPTTTLGDLFNKETATIYINAYSDNMSGIDVDVNLKFAISESVTEGDYFLNGFVTNENMETILTVEIGIHPNDAESGRVYSKLQPILRDLVRHELEHVTHSGDSTSPKASKVMRSDLAMRRKIRSNPDLYYKYYLLPKEVDANIQGLYSKAKTTKKPYQTVINDYLDSLVQKGIIDTDKRKLIYKTWKKRILKIGGIPKLK